MPAYTKKVLKATSAIPLGYVTSYGAIAKAVGGGPRAVGNIMASNPFAPIVPCHRVVKSDFTLGGYGVGLKVKVAIVEKERNEGFLISKEIEVNGGQLTVFPVEMFLEILLKLRVYANHKCMRAHSKQVSTMVNRGLYVGRFQPFHLGHLDAIKYALKRS